MLGKLLRSKKKVEHPCLLCGRELDEKFSPLIVEDDDGEHEIGKICNSCADKLEEIDRDSNE